MSNIDEILSSENLKVLHVGPPLEHGPLPSFFYFALSAKDSLTLYPYHQPAEFLQKNGVRVFSIDLPEHEEGKDPNHALERWAEHYQKGNDLLGDFSSQCAKIVQELVEKEYILPFSLGIGGLSRGAFIATLIAAKNPSLTSLLGFSPLTDLSYLLKFSSLTNSPFSASFQLSSFTSKLLFTNVCFFIGNRDIRVGTKRCFSFIDQLCNEQFENGIRSPTVEMHIFPSIGHKGHGTSEKIFTEGSNWILNQLISRKTR